MSRPARKRAQWGAEVLSEQVNDMDKMSSHTARYASVRALWYEVTGDLDSKERAFRSFNWATYSSREDGLVQTSLEEPTGFWFSDGYGDYHAPFPARHGLGAGVGAAKASRTSSAPPRSCAQTLPPRAEGYTCQAVTLGGFVVRIHHRHSGNVLIQFENRAASAVRGAAMKS
jgi:hypothetical protein